MQKTIYGRSSYRKDAHKETICHKLGVVVRTKLQQRKQSPANLHTRNQVIHGVKREKQGERQLPYHSTDRIYRLKMDQLISMEVEIVREPRDIRIIYSLTVSVCLLSLIKKSR